MASLFIAKMRQICSTCDDVDYCSTIDCVHGDCAESGEGFECACDSDGSWTVNTDSGLCTTSVCGEQSDVCLNEAQCVADIDDPTSLGTCQCRNYDTGANCQGDNGCGPDRDCYGRGTCDTSTLTCTCNGQQYTGSDCGTEVCTNEQTCSNGGSCNGGGSTCSCLYPYLSSARCTDADWCMLEDGETVDCHEGVCVSFSSGWFAPNTDVTGGYNCSCFESYEHDGARTEEDYFYRCTTEVCGDDSRCHNLEECTDTGGGDFQCGPVTEDSNGSQGSIAAMVGGVAAGVAALGSGAAGLMAAARRRKKKKEEEELIVEDLEIDNDRLPNSTAPNSFTGQTWSN